MLKNAIQVIGFKDTEDPYPMGWTMSESSSGGTTDTHTGLLLNFKPLSKSTNFAPVTKAEIKALTEETKVKWEDIQKRIEAGGICD